jgi:hypothetical protein
MLNFKHQISVGRVKCCQKGKDRRWFHERQPFTSQGVFASEVMFKKEVHLRGTYVHESGVLNRGVCQGVSQSKSSRE